MLTKILHALFPRRRYHHRSDGPVIINPHVSEIVEVVGKKEA